VKGREKGEGGGRKVVADRARKIEWLGLFEIERLSVGVERVVRRHGENDVKWKRRRWVL